MVSKLGVSLLPETLADLTEECEVDGGAIDFQGFWKMLQVLRAREGFTVQEATDVHEVFLKFDSTGRGEMPLKRVPAALIWLGYQAGPGVIGKANKQVEIPFTGSSYITEAQFMKLARKHREAELKAVRKVYRTFAEDGGAGKLHQENLQAAVTRLNRLLINDFLDWIKMFRPGARIARKHVSYDPEEFRMIVLHCCEKVRSRIHKNCGYSEVQLSKLRIEFVKYTKDGSSTEVDVMGLMKLFKALLPQSQTSPTVRNRLKVALENNSAKHTGLDWHSFLRVLRGYENLAEIDAEQSVQAGIDELRIPEDCIEKAEELLSLLCRCEQAPFFDTKSDVSSQLLGRDVKFLVQGIAPGLSEEEGEEALDRLFEAERESVEGEFSMVSGLKQLVLEGYLSRSRGSDRPRPHDAMGSF